MLHQCFPKAYELANADAADTELDLRGLLEPLWGHHSARRGADTKARDTMHITGATERDIDLIFGWNEHMYRAVMQLHYESNPNTCTKSFTAAIFWRRVGADPVES